MNKVIKEFNNDNLIYKLGYFLYDDKIYPRIEIYKNSKLLSKGGWSCETYGGFFHFYTSNSSSSSFAISSTIKKMFIELRQANEVPEYIEEEFESLFLLYKLNDFKKL